MIAARIEYLFTRYIKNLCSPEEKDELMAYLRDPRHDVLFRSLIEKVVDETGSEVELPVQTSDLILSRILHSDEAVVIPLAKRKSFWYRRLSVAAAVLVILTAGTIYFFTQNNNDKKSAVVTTAKPSPILPGTDKAVLTMADGTTVVLDSIQNGNLLQPANASVKKKDATLIYNAAGSSKASVEYNTLSTPRGGQYRVVLSDGTGVWLNAASSIRFPTAFLESSRVVDVTGEAYFEVAKNTDKPFIVRVNGMQVNVVGTHFNVNAYVEEEAIKTSLLEGIVQVMTGSSVSRLKPGEQAVLSRLDKNVRIGTADMDAVMAWKNGLFEFQGADIATIMRQIARWYDVEVVIPGKTPARRFVGKISRDAQLSDVLQILELSNIKFRVDGKKIIVQ